MLTKSSNQESGTNSGQPLQSGRLPEGILFARTSSPCSERSLIACPQRPDNPDNPDNHPIVPGPWNTTMLDSDVRSLAI